MKGVSLQKNANDNTTKVANGHESSVAESTPAGLCIFLSQPGPGLESKICENRTRSNVSIQQEQGRRQKKICEGAQGLM